MERMRGMGGGMESHECRLVAAVAAPDVHALSFGLTPLEGPAAITVREEGHPEIGNWKEKSFLVSESSLRISNCFDNHKH